MTRFDRFMKEVESKKGRRSPGVNDPQSAADDVDDSGLQQVEPTTEQATELVDVEAPKRPDVQESKHSSAQMSKTKDPNYQRTTVYLPKPLHKKLKAAAVDEEKEMSDIIESLVDEWLKNRDA